METTRPRLRNGPHGYGMVTKALHWLVLAALVAQFAIGYAMDADDRGRGRGRGRSGESGRGRGRGGGYDVFGDEPLLNAHVVLGIVILTLAVLRLVWRVTTPLPPWAPTLSPAERVLANWTERALYLLTFAIPITGLLLVVGDDEGALAPHVASHVAFFAVTAIHVALVVKHQIVNRDGLLRRMI